MPQKIVYRFGLPNAPDRHLLHLHGAFQMAAAHVGFSLEHATYFFDRFPDTLQNLVAYWDGRGGWLYESEDGMFELDDGSYVMAADRIANSAHRLADLTRIVRDVVHHEDWHKVFTRWGTLGTHNDALEEIEPLRPLAENVTALYEPGGDASPDLRIEVPGGIPLLLEVKRRRSDLFHLFNTLSKKGYTEDNATFPEAKWLFKGVLKKFKAADPGECLQGAWIASGTQHDWKTVRRYFDEQIPGEQLHFTVLTFGRDRAWVLSRSPEIEARVCRTLQILNAGPPPMPAAL